MGLLRVMPDLLAGLRSFERAFQLYPATSVPTTERP
jgi:hypothetical protein